MHMQIPESETDGAQLFPCLSHPSFSPSHLVPSSSCPHKADLKFWGSTSPSSIHSGDLAAKAIMAYLKPGQASGGI